ncbi:MAG: hypothetical protein KBD92_07205, partial [Thiopseudomonas sp.]|nr:hypothetical protein [Thiopseudomonas sp.]
CNSGARHPWLARHTHPEALVDHLQGLHYFRVNHQNNSYFLIMGQFTVWERGRLARKDYPALCHTHPCKIFCVARDAEELGACRTSGSVFIRRRTHVSKTYCQSDRLSCAKVVQIM